MSNDNVDANAASTANAQPANAQKRKHKLEIQVYEADYTDVPDNAPPKWRPVNTGLDMGKPIIIEVADKKELAQIQQQYAMCDQRIKIIREIDPFVDSPSPSSSSSHAIASTSIPQNNQAIPVQAPAPQNEDMHVASRAASKSKQKAKIVTIGDMQVKYDGDKVYQKQWVKLNANEAANFRVVNDSNNKLVSLNGKHIECKKWIVVEEESNADEPDIASLVSGD